MLSTDSGTSLAIKGGVQAEPLFTLAAAVTNVCAPTPPDSLIACTTGGGKFNESETGAEYDQGRIQGLSEIRTLAKPQG